MAFSNRFTSMLRAKKRTAARSFSSSRRRLAPLVETCESRQLLTVGTGFLAGTVFVDSNNNHVLDPSEAYLSGATVQLYNAGGSVPIASQTTGANGQYQFTGLTPGDYLLEEIAPAGYANGGAQANSQLNPATVVAADTIKVTVVDPTKIFVNYGGIVPGSYAVFNETLNGFQQINSAGPMQVSLGTTAGATDLNTGYHTFCVDDIHDLSFVGGEKFSVIAKPISQLDNGSITVSTGVSGRIAYLYNHYGNTALSNIQGAGLQLAIWEMLYNGSNPNFTTGAYVANSPYLPNTDKATFDQVIAQAKAYVSESAGKSETAVFLDAATANPGVQHGLQGMLATGSYNFGDLKGNCNKDALTNVHYIISNGSHSVTVTNLRGHVGVCDTVVADFTVPAGDAETLSLVSYKAPQSYFDANTASQQTVYQSVTLTFGPGEHTLTIKVPCSNFQVDFVCGGVIQKLGPAGSNNFYTPQGRLISADNGGPACAASNQSSWTSYCNTIFVSPCDNQNGTWHGW